MRVITAGALAALLLLAGCTAEAPEPTTSPEPTGAAPEPGGTGADCLLGTWLVDNDAMESNVLTSLGISEFDPMVSVTGEAVTTFEDMVMRTDYRSQELIVEWTSAGTQFRMVTRFDGLLTGAYDATETELTFSEVDDSGLTIENTTYLNGEPVDLSEYVNQIHSGIEAGTTSAYVCDADELSLMPMVEGLDTSAMVTVMHRQ